MHDLKIISKYLDIFFLKFLQIVHNKFFFFFSITVLKSRHRHSSAVYYRFFSLPSPSLLFLHTFFLYFEKSLVHFKICMTTTAARQKRKINCKVHFCNVRDMWICVHIVLSDCIVLVSAWCQTLVYNISIAFAEAPSSPFEILFSLFLLFFSKTWLHHALRLFFRKMHFCSSDQNVCI